MQFTTRRLQPATLVCLSAGIIFLAAGLLAPAPVAERLTDSRVPLSRPAPSPDGRWVAYVRTVEGGDAVAVAALPPTGPLQPTMATGPLGAIVDDLLWIGDPFPLLWVTESQAVWLMGRDGVLATHSLTAPLGVRGCAWDRERQALIVHGRSTVVEHRLPSVSDTGLLVVGGPNSDISRLAVGPVAGALLYVDGGTVMARDAYGGVRAVLAPDPETAEYVHASPITGAAGAFATARRRGAPVASTVVRVDWDTGERASVELDGREIHALTPLDSDRAVVEADGGLWLVDLREGATRGLSAPGTKEADAVVTSDGAWLIVASTGREDLDLDGRVTDTDPPNLYRLPIGEWLRATP